MSEALQASRPLAGFFVASARGGGLVACQNILGAQKFQARTPSDMMSAKTLTREILARSSAPEWEAALLEWELVDVAESEEPRGCLCGHFPIHDICDIHNTVTGARAQVGNCCAKRHLKLPSDAILRSAKRFRADPGKAMGDALLEHAQAKSWIHGWEKAWYRRVAKKKAPDSAQAAKKDEIERKIIHAMAAAQSRMAGPSTPGAAAPPQLDKEPAAMPTPTIKMTPTIIVNTK